MTRTQIQLTEEQYTALKHRARREGISLSASIRAAVDAWLGRSERADAVSRSLASVGKFRSGEKDISRRHDDELARIYAGDRKGR